MLHAHVQSFLKTSALMCLLVNVPIFRKIELNFYLTLYVTCVVFLHSSLFPLSLNPSISIRVYETVVIPKALYGSSELWSSMTPADLRKLEHSHRFCLKHMQGRPRRTPTNFTLSAINAVPMETVINHKKLNFLEQLCNLPCSYMAERVFTIRLTHCQHLDNQSLGFIPDINRILTKYALHHVLD